MLCVIIWDIVDQPIVSEHSCKMPGTYTLHQVFFCLGGQATGNTTFGLSNQRPILLNVTCSGTEYGLSNCDGYGVGEATTDYCLSGQYLAGVRCLEGLCKDVCTCIYIM